jgi:large subunit ribosomal protein L23
MSILDKIIKKEDEAGKAPEKKVAKKSAAKPRAVKQTKAPRVKRVSKGEIPLHYFEIIKKPYISEKAFSAGTQSQYVFIVDDRANKSEIKKAIEKSYNVAVKGVNITNTKAKPKVYRGVKSTRSGFKKAIITLHKGTTIDVMELAK